MGCQALLLGILGFFVAIVIVMFITCPSDGDHRREVRALGEKTVKMYAARQGNILVSGMAMAFGDDLVDMIISQLLEVDNYGVVSIGRLENPKDPSKSQIVSVGAFGHVFTASPEELVEGLGSKLKGLKEEVTNEVEEETRSRVEDAIEEAKENGRKKAEKIANEIKQEAENKVQEIANEATEQANDNLFDNNSSDDENKNGRNVEKP